MDAKLKEALKSCNTMNEIIEATNKHYNLDAKLGFASKLVVEQGIGKLLTLINAKEK